MMYAFFFMVCVSAGFGLPAGTSVRSVEHGRIKRDSGYSKDVPIVLINYRPGSDTEMNIEEQASVMTVRRTERSTQEKPQPLEKNVHYAKKKDQNSKVTVKPPKVKTNKKAPNSPAKKKTKKSKVRKKIQTKDNAKTSKVRKKTPNSKVKEKARNSAANRKTPASQVQKNTQNSKVKKKIQTSTVQTTARTSAKPKTPKRTQTSRVQRLICSRQRTLNVKTGTTLISGYTRRSNSTNFPQRILMQCRPYPDIYGDRFTRLIDRNDQRSLHNVANQFFRGLFRKRSSLQKFPLKPSNFTRKAFSRGRGEHPQDNWSDNDGDLHCPTVQNLQMANDTMTDISGVTRQIVHIPMYDEYQFIQVGTCAGASHQSCHGECHQQHTIVYLLVFQNDPVFSTSFQPFEVPGYCSCKNIQS